VGYHGAVGEQPRSLVRELRWPAAVVVLGLVALLGILLITHDTRKAAVATVDRLGATAVDIAERLRTGHITTTFTASIPRLEKGGGTRLELATFEATELFTREDQRTVLFDLVPLGSTISEIRVPVTYRYHLRLKDPWRLEVFEDRQECLVHAPAIRASLPPAIHTDGMQKRSQSGWLRFDGALQMEALERSITPTLRERAEHPDHIDLVRERCRQRVAEFVRGFLLREDHWRRDRFRAIRVVFADEEETGKAPVTPTLVYSELD
jgi:hypothetical protein